MKRKYSEQAMEQLREAIKSNDIDRVKELIESGEAGISNLECVLAVKSNSLMALEYFVEKGYSVNRILYYGLMAAVKEKNREAIEIFITDFRDNKSRYAEYDIDMMILNAVSVATETQEYIHVNPDESLKLVKYILDTYFKED